MAPEIASQSEEIYVPYNSTIKYTLSNIKTMLFESATVRVTNKADLKNLLSLYAKSRKEPEFTKHSFETAISNDLQIMRYWPRGGNCNITQNNHEPFQYTYCWQKINTLSLDCQPQRRGDYTNFKCTDIEKSRVNSDSNMILLTFHGVTKDKNITLKFTETLKTPPLYDVQLTEHIPSYTFQLDCLSEPTLYATSQIQASESEAIESFVQLKVTYSTRQEIWVVGIVACAMLAAWVAAMWCCRMRHMYFNNSHYIAQY